MQFLLQYAFNFFLYLGNIINTQSLTTVLVWQLRIRTNSYCTYNSKHNCTFHFKLLITEPTPIEIMLWLDIIINIFPLQVPVLCLL